jgi:Zn-dependent alcohol dehydrogenase
VMLGVPKLGTEASFVVNSMYQDKSIMGCRYGSARPHHDIPLVVGFYLDGRFLLDEMVTRTYDLAEIDAALEDLEAGRLNRGVLTLD